MSTAKKVFLLILVTVGIIYGGIKLYLNSQISQRVDKIVQLAEPFVAITYDGISTTLDGTVNLEALEFRPVNITDEFSIDTLSIITPGLGFLLGDAEELFEQGKFPEKMGVKIKGARIDLTGKLIKMMTDMEIQSSGKSPTTGLACTFDQSFQSAQYRELGIVDLVFDTAVHLKYNESEGSLNFNMNMVLQDIEEMDVNFTIEGVNNGFTGMMTSVQAATPVKAMSIRYKPDPDFLHKAKEYCAGLKGASVVDFVSELVDQSDAAYLGQIGFIPGPGIRTAIHKMLTDASEIVITSESSEAFDLNKLQRNNPEKIPELLGLAMTVNDEQVVDLSFSMSPAAKTGSTNKDGSKANQQPEEKVIRLRYHKVPVSQLANKVGFEARIKTSNGKERSGRITKVEDKEVTLKIRKEHGYIAIKIPFAEISRCEVKLWR